MLEVWRDDGYGYDVLELWAAGYPDSESEIEEFADGSTASCFVDDEDPDNSLFEEFDASKDDLFIVDARGNKRHKENLAEYDLEDEENRRLLDVQVRGIID